MLDNETGTVRSILGGIALLLAICVVLAGIERGHAAAAARCEAQLDARGRTELVATTPDGVRLYRLKTCNGDDRVYFSASSATQCRTGHDPACMIGSVP